MGRGMTRSEFLAAFPPGEIHPEYRAGLKLAAVLAMDLARDFERIEREGGVVGVGCLHVFADIAQHLGSAADG
jgi:hypothetical protein